MKIAIYSRKSKYNDNSDSIDQQVQYCMQTAKAKYPEITEYVEYCDEGFSGGNTDRPNYRRMLEDVKKKDIKAIFAYKIDRISRSFLDFANLQAYLDKYKVNIVSASEGFDTGSVWGEAVLNILMVFAQLERNNVRERVTDTMLHYARQGRWTGGLTPFGFESKTMFFNDFAGQNKKMVVLSPVEEELKVVKVIFELYLQYKSIAKVETFLIENGYKTRKNKNFSVSSIHDILINPAYVMNDYEAYNYFANKKADICSPKSEFDGTRGLAPYGRTNKKTNVRNNVSKWVIAVGYHKGVIPGADYAVIQETLVANRYIPPRANTASVGVFAGLFKCKKCGNNMQIIKGRMNKEGQQEFSYKCSLKRASRSSECDIENIVGWKVERELIEFLENASKDKEMLESIIVGADKTSKLESNNNHIEKKILNLKKQMEEKNKIIKNLVEKVSSTSGSSVEKYIVAQIEKLDIEIIRLNDEILKHQDEMNMNNAKMVETEMLNKALSEFENFHHLTDIALQRQFMKTLIDHIDWDGNNLRIWFNNHSDLLYFETGSESSCFIC